MNRGYLSAFGVFTILGALAMPGVWCQSSRADVVYDFTVNTQPLIDDTADGLPYYLGFSLFNLNGSTVTLSNFQFGGGSATPPGLGFGNVTGDATSSIVLGSGTVIDEFYEAFTPGTQLSFQIDASPMFGSPPADFFDFFITDDLLNNLPTVDPSGNDNLAQLTFDVPQLTPNTYAFDTTAQTFTGNYLDDGGEPTLTPASAPVPLPRAAGMVVGLLAIVLGVSMRRKFSSRSGTAAFPV